MQIDDPSVQCNFQELAQILARTDDSTLIESFLRSLFTPAEIVDIAARWALVKALDKKIPQREIAKQYGISLCKITRGSRELRAPDSPFRQILERQCSDGE
ncbi:MAG: trp operon repressor [Treponema sp.]|jgi:TrpR family trp operon transcriptional repressor|nr:trp operon repressor [Treponema sp.]